MSKPKPIRIKTILRALIALSMLIIWSFVLMTGIFLWLAPRGQGAGQTDYIIGLNRHEIGDIHFYFSVIAVILTLVHVFIDWKAFKGLMRYLVHAGHRSGFEELHGE